MEIVKRQPFRGVLWDVYDAEAASALALFLSTLASERPLTLACGVNLRVMQGRGREYSGTIEDQGVALGTPPDFQGIALPNEFAGGLVIPSAVGGLLEILQAAWVSYVDSGCASPVVESGSTSATLMTFAFEGYGIPLDQPITGPQRKSRVAHGIEKGEDEYEDIAPPPDPFIQTEDPSADPLVLDELPAGLSTGAKVMVAGVVAVGVFLVARALV